MNLKYSIGDRLKIVGDTCGHGFDVGNIVEVQNISDLGYELRLDGSSGVDTWYADDEDVELYETSTQLYLVDEGYGELAILDFIPDYAKRVWVLGRELSKETEVKVLWK